MICVKKYWATLCLFGPYPASSPDTFTHTVQSSRWIHAAAPAHSPVLYTWCFVSTEGVIDGLNTGVNTGLLSTSNTLRITEGEEEGGCCSFEASVSSFFYTLPIFHHLHLCSSLSPTSTLSFPLFSVFLPLQPTLSQISVCWRWWWAVIGRLCVHFCN